MTLPERLTVERVNLDWAQWVARKYHYMQREVHPRACPFAYRILFDGQAIQPDGQPSGMIMFATVHYLVQHGLFGYDLVGLQNGHRVWMEEIDRREVAGFLDTLGNWQGNHPDYQIIHEAGIDKWQVLVLSRMWLHDNLPRNSETVCLAKIWRRIQYDWLEHHPPVDSSKPYHICLIISWSDLGVGHQGTVYKAANFKEIKRTVSQPRHGKSATGGGGGANLIQYVYRLKTPRWKWEQPSLFSLLEEETA